MEPQEVDGDLFPRMRDSASWIVVECPSGAFPPGGWRAGLGQVRAQEFGAEGVSGGAGVQFVLEKKFGFGHSISPDRFRPKVDINKILSGGDVFAQQLVGQLLLVSLLPSQGTWIETEKDNFHLRQRAPNLRNIGFEIGEDLFGRLS